MLLQRLRSKLLLNELLHQVLLVDRLRDLLLLGHGGKVDGYVGQASHSFQVEVDVGVHASLLADKLGRQEAMRHHRSRCSAKVESELWHLLLLSLQLLLLCSLLQLL